VAKAEALMPAVAGQGSLALTPVEGDPR